MQKKSVRTKGKTVEIDLADPFYTVEEVAVLLKVTESGVLTKLRNGEINGVKKFGKWFVFKSDILAYLLS